MPKLTRKRGNNILAGGALKKMLLIALDKQFIHDYHFWHYLEKFNYCVYHCIQGLFQASLSHLLPLSHWLWHFSPLHQKCSFYFDWCKMMDLVILWVRVYIANDLIQQYHCSVSSTPRLGLCFWFHFSCWA